MSETLETPSTPATGSLSVLNVGAGDLTITFDPGNAEETVKGLRMLMDMQRRGYLIAVKLPDGSYVRAEEIDPTAGAYVISLPEDAPPALLATMQAVALETAADQPKRRGRPRKVKVPIATSEAVGVARSAGG